MSGEGKSEPKDYLIKGNVDAKVIEDVFNFVKK
jgi:hypothetical protein